jgi:hypothetical protein
VKEEGKTKNIKVIREREKAGWNNSERGRKN